MAAQATLGPADAVGGIAGALRTFVFQNAELKALCARSADAAIWTIPGARTKNKRPHMVPLSPAALAVVNAGFELLEEGDEFLFPSPIKRTAPIDGHALAVAMRRMAESDKLTGRGSKTWKIDPPTPHDLRRTFATRLAELGVEGRSERLLKSHANRCRLKTLRSIRAREREARRNDFMGCGLDPDYCCSGQ